MPRPAALTAIAVSRLKKPARGRVELRDGLVPGFGVRVTEDGARSWVFVYVSPVTGKRRRFTIGPVGNPGDKFSVTLEDARAEAYRLRQAVREGRCPMEERRQGRARGIADRETREAHTFDKVADLFIKRHAAQRRRGWETEQIIARELRPAWGKRLIGEITDVDVQVRVDALVDVGKRESGRKLLNICKSLFGWAAGRPAYGLDRNNLPTRNLTASKLVGASNKRDRVLSNDEIRALWHAADALGYPGGACVQLLLMTALRRSEAAEAVWQEIDMAEGVWIIPAARMKAGKPHAVPLTPDVVDLLNGLLRFSGDYLFTTAASAGAKPINTFSNVKKLIDDAMRTELRKLAAERGEDASAVRLEPWELRDLRRTVRTNLSALPIAENIRELLLAHALPSIKQTYDVHDHLEAKREALTLWQARLRSIVDPPPAGKVVRLAKRRKA
jgi:integrase